MVLGFPTLIPCGNQNSKEWPTTNEAVKFLGVLSNAVRLRIKYGRISAISYTN